MWRRCIGGCACVGRLAVLGCHPALCAQADGRAILKPTVKTLNPTPRVALLGGAMAAGKRQCTEQGTVRHTGRQRERGRSRVCKRASSSGGRQSRAVRAVLLLPIVVHRRDKARHLQQQRRAGKHTEHSLGRDARWAC